MDVSHPDRPVDTRAPLPWWARLLLIVGGGCVIALLATAASLRPDSRGHGTHRQLGLPPCSFLQVMRFRCPSCGMTTSWSNLLRGRVVAALQANTGGVLLCLSALAAAPWAVVSGVRGRWWIGRPHELAIAGVAGVVMLVTLVDWILRITA